MDTEVNEDNLYSFGRYCLEKGKYTEAEKCFSILIQSFDRKSKFYFSRAKARENMKNYEGAIEDYNQVIELEPNRAVTYVSRAAIRILIEDYKGAAEDGYRAIELDPRNPMPYSNLGVAKIYLEDYIGAIEVCTKAIALDSTVVKFYYARARAARRLKNYESAIKDYTKTIEIDAKSAYQYAHRAICKSKIGDYEGALEDCNKALEIEPNNINALLSRTEANCELKNCKSAIEDCNTIIALDCNEVRAYNNRGKAFAGLNDWEKALIDFDKTIEINPTEPIFFKNRAATQAEMKNYRRAIQDCKKGLELAPYDAYFYSLMGTIYDRSQDEIEKIICCHRIAAEIEPQNPEYLFRIANLYSEWEKRKIINDSFFDSLGDFGQTCKNFYVDQQAYQERSLISKAFYSRAFQHLLPLMRTDLKEEVYTYTLYLFIGNEDFMFSPLKDKSFFFSDARSFPDKTTDCPLLNPINQSKLAVQMSYNNVRIRCLCELEGHDGIEKCRSLWDRYANGHGGIAYKLRIEKSWLIDNSIYTNKIRYTDKEIDIKCESPEQVIEDGLFIKDIGYVDEREWRMVRFGEFEDLQGHAISWEYQGNMGVIIESVFLGITMPDELKKECIKLAKIENISVYNMALGTNGTLKAIEVMP